MVALRYLVGFIVSLLLMASALEAVQISLPEVTAAAGERVRIPVDSTDAYYRIRAVPQN